jgi:pimeloyl-ACP methyl ester carboxylesterase
MHRLGYIHRCGAVVRDVVSESGIPADAEEKIMTTSLTPTTGLVGVGAATLYHEVRGRGPALLLVSGGDGDAGLWSHVAPALATEFTVVTYDRRGMSRSPRPDGWTVTSVDEQADDAAALLRTLGLAPAVVVGHSGGASITCAMVTRHPDVVRHAVCYEPPLLAVVPDGAAVVGGLRAKVEQAMVKGGPRRAMEAFIRANAGDEAYDSWLASTDPALRERIFGNAETFFAIDLPAFAAFVPDLDRLRAGGVPLTVVVGEDNRDGWYGAAARWLVEGTGASRIELPGGHGGFVTHQEEFVTLVRRVGLAATADTAMPTRVRHQTE